MHDNAEMALSGSNGSLKLKLVRYQFPEIEDCEWDSNWLIVAGRASIGGREWTFQDPCLTTFEARRLADWFDQVAKGEGDETIGFVEPNLEFERKSKQIVRVSFALESAPPWAGEDDDWGQHGFDVPIGHQLAVASAHLRQQFTQFPMRSRPSGPND